MWSYEKRLQYPIHITTPNAKMASYIISQYGGPDGELGASMRYLSQRFSAYNPRVAGLLTDIGTEELAHLEMIGAIVRQLTKGLSAKELETAGFAPYYIDHTAAVCRRQPAVCHSVQQNFSVRAMPSQILWRIWRRNRKQEKRMTIFFDLQKIRKWQIRYAF